MRIFTILSFILISSITYAQKEGQTFCKAYTSDSYFPLDIKIKKIFWQNTHYTEERLETKTIKGKEYTGFSQLWKEGNSDTMYLREENGIVYQYEECCEAESVRFDPSFKEGHTWTTVDKGATYTIDKLNGTLKTPFCNYENLIVIDFKLTSFQCKFYYKKGYGYIGATSKDILISCVTPTFDLD